MFSPDPSAPSPSFRTENAFFGPGARAAAHPSPRQPASPAYRDPDPEPRRRACSKRGAWAHRLERRSRSPAGGDRAKAPARRGGVLRARRRRGAALRICGGGRLRAPREDWGWRDGASCQPRARRPASVAPPPPPATSFAPIAETRVIGTDARSCRISSSLM